MENQKVVRVAGPGRPRLSPELVHQQAREFAGRQTETALADAMPLPVLVLNGSRQIIFANQAARVFVGPEAAKCACGKRPGEFLECRNSAVTPGGCGTAPECRSCGAARALTACEQSAKAAVDVCRIVRRDTGRAYEFRAAVAPMPALADFMLCSMLDLSDQARRRVLERAFFHDALNLLGAAAGYSRMLDTSSRPAAAIHRLIQSVINEVESQRDLSAAEDDTLAVAHRAVDVRAYLEVLCEEYRGHPACRERVLEVEPNTTRVAIGTDPALLGRALGNMIKNALEATPPGGKVRVGAAPGDESVTFRVHNTGVVPEEVRHEIFVRPVSTKGTGRGIGTYAIRLLAERYLAGRVWFTSTAEAGTTFYVSVPYLLT